jgi:hypothetical protein
VTSHVTSEGVTPPSSLLRAHAPDHRPPHASVVPRSWGLCRLSRVPAGLWPFPTLSLPSVWRCLDPYPAVFVRCTYPFLPQRQRPHVTGNTFGTRENPCKAISTGSVVSGLQSFAHVQAPPLARPPDRSHRNPQTGRPGRLHHASPQGLPASGCGIATCLIWAIDMAGLAPARWQPCRLLLPAYGSYLGCLALMLRDAHAPTHATQAPGSASGLRAIGTCSPWSTAFPPPPP